MRRVNFHNDFEVIYKRIKSCPISDVDIHLFQFIYIIYGDGSYSINDNSYSFQKGDLFLITPNDKHQFVLNRECDFVVLKIQKKYIEDYSWKSINYIECLLHYSYNIVGSVLNNEKDKSVVKSLIDTILKINNESDTYNEDLLRSLINAIIVITARNLSDIQPKSIASNSDAKIVQILNFIQSNIYTPSQLRASVISDKFRISENYLSLYFKKQCGETFQSFINKSRLRLIKNRLKFSDCRINEIVDEFGFSDESHINKFFKKHEGISLAKFRKNHNTTSYNKE